MFVSIVGSMIAPFLNIFYLLAQWFILINSLSSMIHPPCYTYCILAVGITHVIATVQNCGRPQFAGWYAQLIMKEENTMIAVYAFVLLMGAKHIIFLSPIILRSLFMACYLTQGFCRDRLPVSVYSWVKPLLKRVTVNSVWFNKSVAMCEVFVGLFLIFACFLFSFIFVFVFCVYLSVVLLSLHFFVCFVCLFSMSRTVIMTLIYWQVMQARYMNSGYIRMTFSDLHLRISSVLSAVPFVLNLYLKLAGILGNMVDPAVMQQRMQGGGGGISGMVSKMCIVM